MHGESFEAHSREVMFLQKEHDTFKKEVEDLRWLFEKSDGEFRSRGYELALLQWELEDDRKERDEA